MDQRLQIYTDCAAKAWNPVWGDADAIGLGLLALYALASLAAVLILKRAPFPPNSLRRERLFWALVSLLLIFLTINKQLDLQVFLTATARCVARAEGWYRARRVFQQDTTYAILAAGIVFVVIMGLLLRGTLRRNMLALLGLAGILTFVGVRLVSFHHFDQLLGITLLSTKLHRILEALALLVLLAGETLILTRRSAASVRRV